MKIIFDCDEIDDVDYIEVKLNEDEVNALLSYEPLEKEVDNKLTSKSMLNIYIRRMHNASQKG